MTHRSSASGRAYPALTVTLRATRRINPFTRRGLLNDRHEAGTITGRAKLLDYF